MDPRMRALADFVGILRQDWRPQAIHNALSMMTWMPYQDVAVGAVRAATNPAAKSPFEMKNQAEKEGRRGPDLPPKYDRRLDHRPADPDTAARAAAMARALIHGAAQQEAQVMPEMNAQEAL